MVRRLPARIAVQLAASFLLLLAPVLASAPRPEGKTHSPVSYTRPKVAGVWAHVVTADLKSPAVQVRPLVPEGARRATFGRLVNRAAPVAAINGTFFDPRTSTVLGMVVEDGLLIRDGWLGSAIRIDGEGRGTLLPLKRRHGGNFDWSEVRFAISSGPTLLQNGRIALNPWAEGFSDPSVFRPARRSALGLTRSNKLLLVAVTKPVSLRRLAMVMQALGARHAVNLDGGSSTGLYYGGRHIVKPARSMTNAVGIFLQAR